MSGEGPEVSGLVSFAARPRRGDEAGNRLADHLRSYANADGFSEIRAWSRERVCDLTGPVCEVGPGGGETLRALVAAGRPVIFADASEFFAAALRDVAPGVVADLTALPFASNRFAGVLADRVLHHVVDLSAAVAEVHRVLRPDGRFTVTLPDFASLQVSGTPVGSAELRAAYLTDGVVCARPDSVTRLGASDRFQLLEMVRQPVTDRAVVLRYLQVPGLLGRLVSEGLVTQRAAESLGEAARDPDRGWSLDLVGFLLAPRW